MIDLRSDTVTTPTPEMLRAMTAAEVGDDVYGEDPSLNRLEEEVAALLGKEAAVFTPSGSMANQIAILLHTRPGDSVLCEEGSHTFAYEAGAGAALSGVQFDLIPFSEKLSDNAIKDRFRPDGLHESTSTLMLVENTHNRGRGRALPRQETQRIVDTAHGLGLKAHCDGARLWNAAVATGHSERELAAGFDTVSVCFSKGLGAPVGSALAGSREDVAVSRFDGREGALSVDGEVANLMLGADWTRGRATAGLMLSHARGSGGYRGASSGGIEASLTGLYPYGRYEASERLSVWGVAGYGEGTLTVDPETQVALETGMDLAMASVGVRGVLLEAPADGGAELAVTSDALAVRTTSEAVRTDAGNLEAAQARVTRLRLGLEGSRAFGFEGDAHLTPSVELGVRHDGGDAETGFGADIGAGLAWSDPARGLSADLRARGLLTHEDGSFRERGFAGALAWDPAPQSERGPSLSLTRTVGAQATGGVEALLGPQTARALEAANDNDGDELERRALEAKAGYGFALFGGGWTGTPELRLGLTGTSRETVLAWRLAEETRAGLAFGLDVEGAREESAGARAGHRLGLGFGWRLEGAGAQAFEVRFEGSRVEPANDGAEHRVGLTLTARW